MSKSNMIGIISDTHDNMDSLRKAVDKFNEADCSLVIHAGDFISPFTAQEFMRLKGDFIGVFGNNDGEKKGLKENYVKIGEIHKGPYKFKYHGKRFVVMHKPKKVDKYLKKDSIDVIIYGHLHKIDIRPGKPMVINPGECGSWLTDKSTIVLLDVSTMNYELVEL